MTIHNFYFVAAYGVWIYILLCFVAKLLLDRCKRAAAKRRLKKIQKFFMPSQTRGKHSVKFSKILRYTKDQSLFICACESYIKGLDSYSQAEKQQFSGYMNRIFYAKAHNDRPRNVMEKCRIASREALCGISTSQTGTVLKNSAQDAAMAEFWTFHRKKQCMQKGVEDSCAD